jgi:hypothetical protein
MLTLTLTNDVLERLRIRSEDLADQRRLEGNARRVLEPLLASRGFNVLGTVYISALPTNDGFVLTQVTIA